MNHGKENQPQRSQRTQRAIAFFLCVPLCSLWFSKPFQKIIKSLFYLPGKHFM